MGLYMCTLISRVALINPSLTFVVTRTIGVLKYACMGDRMHKCTHIHSYSLTQRAGWGEGG